MRTQDIYCIVKISARKWAVSKILFKTPWDSDCTSVYEVIAYFSDWPKALDHIKQLAAKQEATQ